MQINITRLLFAYMLSIHRKQIKDTSKAEKPTPTQKRLCCFRLVNVAVALGEVLFFCSLFYSTFFLFYVIRFIQLNLKSSPRSSLSSSHQKYLLSPFTVSYKKKTCLNYILKHIYPEASPTELSETYFWVNGVKLILALLGNMWGTLIWKGTFILK